MALARKRKVVASGSTPVAGLHYPEKRDYKDYQHYNDLRVAYDTIYQMQSELKSMREELAKTRRAMDGQKSELQRTIKRSIQMGFVGGFPVKPAGVLTNGMTLKYNSATGMLEFQ